MFTRTHKKMKTSGEFAGANTGENISLEERIAEILRVALNNQFNYTYDREVGTITCVTDKALSRESCGSGKGPENKDVPVSENLPSTDSGVPLSGDDDMIKQSTDPYAKYLP